MDNTIKTTLEGISTATLTTVLLRKGLRNVWIRGAFPRQHGQARVVGPAFTLRFVPAREDLATPASWGSPISTRAFASSRVSRSAPWTSDSAFSMKPPGNVHKPSRGSMARRQSNILSSHSGIQPTTIFGFS